MIYLALACFLLSVVWLAYVLVVLRPKAQKWHDWQVNRKYKGAK